MRRWARSSSASRGQAGRSGADRDGRRAAARRGLPDRAGPGPRRHGGPAGRAGADAGVDHGRDVPPVRPGPAARHRGGAGRARRALATLLPASRRRRLALRRRSTWTPPTSRCTAGARTGWPTPTRGSGPAGRTWRGRRPGCRWPPTCSPATTTSGRALRRPAAPGARRAAGGGVRPPAGAGRRRVLHRRAGARRGRGRV